MSGNDMLSQLRGYIAIKYRIFAFLLDPNQWATAAQSYTSSLDNFRFMFITLARSDCLIKSRMYLSGTCGKAGCAGAAKNPSLVFTLPCEFFLPNFFKGIEVHPASIVIARSSFDRDTASRTRLVTASGVSLP
jgi:hypothetical protein